MTTVFQFQLVLMRCVRLETLHVVTKGTATSPNLGVTPSQASIQTDFVSCRCSEALKKKS